MAAMGWICVLAWVALVVQPLDRVSLTLRLAVHGDRWQDARESLEERINRLVRDLGSRQFTLRQRAEEQLLEIGPAARDAVARAAASDDWETRIRAQRLLEILDQMAAHLQPQQQVVRPEMRAVCSVCVSPDGRHVYAAALVGTITLLHRDVETGQLQPDQTVSAGGDTYRGMVAFRLSPDGRYGIGTAMHAPAVVLFMRDVETGHLTPIQIIRERVADDAYLLRPLDTVFSPDGRFVYVIDARGPTIADPRGRGAAVATFRLQDDRLDFVQMNYGRDDCFESCRGIAISPDGRWLYVVGYTAGTLVALARDPDTGLTEVRQVIRDSDEGINGLAGANSVACSDDGRFVYVSAGRFEGAQGVSVYAVDDGGHLTLIQEILDGAGELTGFLGGNEVLTSGDGRFVFAAATRSNVIAVFRRDPENGKLSFLENRGNDLEVELGPAGLALSPDDQFLYAAIETAGAIDVYRRRVDD